MEDTWVEVEGYPNYAVSNRGEVLNLITNHRLAPRPNDRGYLRVALSNEGVTRDYYIHQLVAQAFLSRFVMGDRLIHVNGDITDNSAGNLYMRKDVIERSVARRKVRMSWGRPIRVLETGKVYLSVRDCAEDIEGDYSSIYQVLRGDRKSHKGLTFEYHH